MASGKQLSFQYGEVSPSLRFRSDAVSYSAGLSKLKNMYVRREGGVSNRAGFEIQSLSPYQENVSSLQTAVRIKSFIWANTEITCVETTGGVNRLYVDDSDITYLFYKGRIFNIGTAFIQAPTPSEVRFTATKDGIFVTPACYIDYDGIGLANIFIKNNIAYVVQKDEIFSVGAPPASATVTAGFSGVKPFLPVSYLVTATMKDGREVRFYDVASTVTDPAAWGNGETNPAGNTLCYPHASLTSWVKIVFSSVDVIADVKNFNFYRAAGAQGPQKSFYKLAGRINNLGGSATITFQDYGADDVGQTPPLDSSMFDRDYPFVEYNVLDIVDCATYYQQRLLIAGSGNNTTSVLNEPGQIGASKLGAPRQFSSPTISSDIGAFTFSVPTTDGSKVVGMLSMQRAIVFTSKGTYIIRGGEQGILTPSTVNPLKISEEGCSSYIEPVQSGVKGFWINTAGTKLMAIKFGDDGNVTVAEASLLSKHFLEGRVIQLLAVGAEETTLFMLLDTGKIVQVTISEDNVFGFSMIETNGYVESIFDNRGFLCAYINRNGLRFKEQINLRQDKNSQYEVFSDLAVNFGTALTLDRRSVGAPGYIKIVRYTPWNIWNSIDPFGLHINIESGSHNWLANETIKIRSNINLITTLAEQEFVIDFFYDELDENGEVVLDMNGRPITSKLRYVLNTSIPAVNTGETVAAPWGYTALTKEFSGYFTTDVPEQLRNVRGQFTVNDIEYFDRQTRWTPAFRYIKSAYSATPDATKLLSLFKTANGGAPLSISVEGKAISSPLNSSMETSIGIENDGVYDYIDLGDFYSYGCFGIPYESDFETLDMETSDSRTLTDSRKIINAVGVAFNETRGGYFGIEDATLSNMAPISPTNYSPFNNQSELDNFNGHISIPIPTNWSERGRVRIRQVDPLPMTILSVYPKGVAGD
jgi:hypothetical protein